MIMSNHPTTSNEGLSAAIQIHELTREVIEKMSNQQLVDAICRAELPFLRKSDHARLPSLDRNTLERLIYLARQYC